MRVVSLVPSWTETLLECGVEVVGRTRFCLHPKDRVGAIPRVGGTKDWNWERIAGLKPDLLVLDKEENPRFMAEKMPFVATHVTSVTDMPASLGELEAALGGNGRLGELKAAWEARLARGPRPAWALGQPLPGLLEWGREPSVPVREIVYVIWKDPWMAVSRSTFVGSMLAFSGLGAREYPEKYPKLDLTPLDRASTLLLFSPEPYPFLRKREGLAELGFPYAFVNGESFSWFGVRALRFLETFV